MVVVDETWANQTEEAPFPGLEKSAKGGTEAECSKALLWRRINEKQKIPDLPPGLENLFKK